MARRESGAIGSRRSPPVREIVELDGERGALENVRRDELAAFEARTQIARSNLGEQVPGRLPASLMTECDDLRPAVFGAPLEAH